MIRMPLRTCLPPVPSTHHVRERDLVTSARYTAPIGALIPTGNLDATFFALSDPTRRSILERLGERRATLSELAEPFGLTLNGVKKHVGILERADLVVTEKVGRTRQCSLGSAGVGEASDWLEAHQKTWEARLDRFGDFVERTSGGKS